jgi:uncharacterized membrane protein YhhN
VSNPEARVIPGRMNRLRFAYFFISTLFVVSLTVHPYPGSYCLKPLPVLIMAFLSYSYLKGHVKYLMVAGFVFSGIGDVLLDIDRVRFFVPALVSFLITHILYAVAFAEDFKYRKGRLIIVGAIIAYVATIYYYAELGDLVLPVLAYMAVISAMGILAAFSRRPAHGVLLGALLFILSDSLIAINKFVFPLPYSTILVVSIYYCAQYRIGMGMLTTMVRYE